MSSEMFYTLLGLAIISYFSIGIAAAALAYLHYKQYPKAYRSKFNQDVAGFYIFFWPFIVVLFLALLITPKFVLAVARFGKAYFEFIDKLKGKIS